MNEVLPSLGGVALFAAAGLGAAELFPGLRSLPLVRRLGYAYLLGIALVAGSLWALSHGLGVPLRRPAIWSCAAVPALAGLVARRLRREERKERAARPIRRPLWRRLTGALVSAVLAFVCLGIFAEAVTNPVGNWDSRMIWSAQAIYLRAEGTVDAEVLREWRWYIDHPRYPILLPLAQVAVQEGFGAPQDRQWYRALYAALLPAFLLVLGDGARRWAGRGPAALASLAAVSVPALTVWTAGGAASAYSDLPLACFFGAGLVLLLSARRSLLDGLAAGLFLGAAVLTKNEGIFLACSGLLLGGSSLGWKKHWRRLAAAAVPVVLACALFVSWKSAIPNRHDEKYASFVDPGDFWPEAVTRIPLMAGVIAREMFLQEVWGYFWWMAPAVLLVGWRGWRGRRRAVSVPLLLGFASPLVVVWGAYTVHRNPVFLAPVTWNRFLVQASLPLFLLLSLSLRDLLRRVRSIRDAAAAVWRPQRRVLARRAGGAPHRGAIDLGSGSGAGRSRAARPCAGRAGCGPPVRGASAKRQERQESGQLSSFVHTSSSVAGNVETAAKNVPATSSRASERPRRRSHRSSGSSPTAPARTCRSFRSRERGASGPRPGG